MMSSAVEAFKQGRLVVLPTETVYGLSAPIDQPELLKKIFTLKERPFFDPLIVHVHDTEQAKSLVAQWPEIAERLAKAFWPGPLTLVLEKNPTQVSDLITSGLNTVGIRCPKHKVALKFIKEVGVPLAAPSANKFGKTSPTSIEHVQSEFKEQDVYYLDGGPCQVGIESTIVGIKGNTLTVLRSGVISEKELKPLLKDNEKLVYHSSHEVVAPGQVKHHYMPNVPLVFFRTHPTDNLLKEVCKDIGVTQLQSLELPHEAEIAARVLYSNMRDKAKRAKGLYCYIDKSKDQDPQWLGIIDRLNKASQLQITEPDQS
ncbi:MAG: threonylcarbamoyl-AMP synthase [Bdellovibrionales bacterium]|nr:threonylcarbamoyl-AMP synthase [Bdellovibrionales bacterium]